MDALRLPTTNSVSTGWPILDDGLGGVECAVVGQVALGDHTVFVGGEERAAPRYGGPGLSSTGWNYGG